MVGEHVADADAGLDSQWNDKLCMDLVAMQIAQLFLPRESTANRFTGKYASPSLHPAVQHVQIVPKLRPKVTIRSIVDQGCETTRSIDQGGEGCDSTAPTAATSDGGGGGVWVPKPT